MVRTEFSDKDRRNRRRQARIGAVCLAAALPIVGLQFIPSPPMTNPPVDQTKTIESNLRVPEPVRRTLYRACGNCHSNRTEWPWYSRVAPMSWLVAADVNAARAELNFSEWSSGPGATANLSISWLTMSCADVQADRMPLKRYLLLHPESRLTAQEKEDLCNWTQTEIARISAKDTQEAVRLTGAPPQSQ